MAPIVAGDRPPGNKPWQINPPAALTGAASARDRQCMDTFWACIEIATARQFLPDALASARDYDARRTIHVPGVGEHVSVDFWAPVMAAYLESRDGLADCKTEKDILVRLIGCLLITDLKDCSNSEQLGARALELAIQVETLRAALRDVTERN